MAKRLTTYTLGLNLSIVVSLSQETLLNFVSHYPHAKMGAYGILLGGGRGVGGVTLQKASISSRGE